MRVWKPYDWIGRMHAVHPSLGAPSRAEQLFFTVRSWIRVFFGLIASALMRRGLHLTLMLIAFSTWFIFRVRFPSFQIEEGKKFQAALTSAAALLALYQYIRGKAEARVIKLKEHADAFFAEDLSSIYHNMIYVYSNAEFETLDAACAEHVKNSLGAAGPQTSTSTDAWHRLNGIGLNERRAVWMEILAGFLISTAAVPRFAPMFHPAFFQGTEEERRLDLVLTHFDTLGLFYKSNMIDLVQAYDLYGDQLSTMVEKHVLAEYFRVIDGAWERKPEALPAYCPFVSFRILMADIQKLEMVLKKLRRFAKALFKMEF